VPNPLAAEERTLLKGNCAREQRERAKTPLNQTTWRSTRRARRGPVQTRAFASPAGMLAKGAAGMLAKGAAAGARSTVAAKTHRCATEVAAARKHGRPDSGMEYQD